MNKQEYTNFIAPYAVEGAKGSKIFPSVIISRAIIETGNGKGQFATSKLQTEANNHFGITADKTYTGKKMLIQTWEAGKIPTYGEEKLVKYNGNGTYTYLRYFRAYSSPLDSVKDFVNLVSNGRYKAANTATEPKEQAVIIAKAGYATSPNSAALWSTITDEVESKMKQILDYVKLHPIRTAGGTLLTFAVIGLLLFLIIESK